MMWVKLPTGGTMGRVRIATLRALYTVAPFTGLALIVPPLPLPFDGQRRVDSDRMHCLGMLWARCVCRKLPYFGCGYNGTDDVCLYACFVNPNQQYFSFVVSSSNNGFSENESPLAERMDESAANNNGSTVSILFVVVIVGSQSPEGNSSELLFFALLFLQYF